MPSINKEYRSYLNQTSCHTGKKKFENKCTNDKIYCRVRDHCHYPGKCEGAGHSICNSKYSIPKYNLGFECDFHFFANTLFWASVDNLCLKHPGSKLPLQLGSKGSQRAVEH